MPGVRLSGERPHGDRHELGGEVDLDLAIEAADAKPERRYAGLVVLVAAVGTEVARLHGPTVRARSAHWVALWPACPAARDRRFTRRYLPRMPAERRFERVLEITRDILRLRELDLALESIARGVSDLFGFTYVTIVLADGNQTGEMTRRVMLGYDDDAVRERKNERVSKAEILSVLAPNYEVFDNAFYIPAEREFHWEQAIFASDADRDSPRATPDSWHERDSLCVVLRDSEGEMIGYLSPDGPADGKIPTRETLRGLQLFVNLMGLALANAQAHRAEVERRRLLEANQARLRHEATHDALTGLPNRTFFQERLAATLEHARANPDSVYAVLFVDLDEFKAINDSLGHMAGDALLMAIGERMRATIGPDDLIARIGGDEFALLLAHRRDLGHVEDAVETIQDALVAPMLVESRAVYTTASIGIAVIEPTEERIEEVLRNADTAMYHAKALGRGRHAFFDHHMHYEAARRLALTSDCAPPSRTKSSASSTSPSCAWTTAASRASKRSCAGAIPRRARKSCPASSSRWRKTSGSSCRSAASCSSTPAAASRNGGAAPRCSTCACT